MQEKYTLASDFEIARLKERLESGVVSGYPMPPVVRQALVEALTLRGAKVDEVRRNEPRDTIEDLAAIEI